MADAFIIAIAAATLVAVARRPRPARPATAFLLILLTGGWLWENLWTTDWYDWVGGVKPALGMDPITEAMLLRGWPLSPWMICPVHGMRFHRSGLEPFILVFDWVVLVAALCLVKAAIWLAKAGCERWLHRREGMG